MGVRFVYLLIICATDAKHVLFLDEDKGGFGFKSFLDVDLISTVRELEIVLNGYMLDSRVSRSRLQSYSIRHEREDERILLNFIGNAIEKISRYGFHVRDKNDGLMNYILYDLNHQKRYLPIGHESFRHNNKCSMGLGKPKNLRLGKQNFSFFGRIVHNLVMCVALP